MDVVVAVVIDAHISVIYKCFITVLEIVQRTALVINIVILQTFA